MIPVDEGMDVGFIPVQDAPDWIDTAVPDFEKWHVSIKTGSKLFNAQGTSLHRHIINFKALGHALALCDTFTIEEHDGEVFFDNPLKRGTGYFINAQGEVRELVTTILGPIANHYEALARLNNKQVQETINAIFSDGERTRTQAEIQDYLAANPKAKSTLDFQPFLSPRETANAYFLARDMAVGEGVYIAMAKPSPNYQAFISSTVLDWYRFWLRSLSS